MTTRGRLQSLATILFLALLCFAVAALPPSASAEEEIKEVALDFDDVDIRLFIRVISELTGKNFIIDNNVRGKVTVLSPKKLTTRQSYEVFKSVLAVNGFTLVESGEIIKIIPAQNMDGQSIPISTRKPLRGDDQFITQIMPLKYLDANVILPLLKPLGSKQASLFATPSADLLVVTDYRSNIRKIDRLLDEIDIEISDALIEKIDLKYAAAATVTSQITQVLEAKYGKTRKGVRPVFFKIIPVDRLNALIAVAPTEIHMDIRGILAEIDHPTPEGKSLLNVYYLENANAEDMVQILTETQKAMSETGSAERIPTELAKTEAGGEVTGGTFKALGKDISITADKSTNSLIVYASPDDYNIIKEMIRKLDIPRQQLFIEALIMEVSPNEDFAFGAEWYGFRDVGHPLSDGVRHGIIGGSESSGDLDDLFSSNAINLGQGFSLGMIGEAISVGDFTFPSLSVLIRAMETLSTTNILSKPQLVTLNNEPATINVSENRPFETSTTTSPDVGVTQSIEYRDVGIILNITPHINKAGKIKLEISQEVSTLSGTVTGDRPITLKRAIDTVVEVADGSTIVIGGLIQEQRDFSRGATPCMGDVPLLGWAFKSVGITDTRTNLLVFISPRVLDEEEDARDLTREKIEYMEGERLRGMQGIEEERPFFKEPRPKPEEPQEAPE